MNKNIKNLIIISIFLISYFVLSEILNIYIPCLFHKITNLYCPGCGVTRMLLSILRGDFYQAFRYNQLLFILLPVFVLYFVNYIYSLICNRISLLEKTPQIIWYVLIIVLLLFGVLRNIFPYFAPTVI